MTNVAAVLGAGVLVALVAGCAQAQHVDPGSASVNSAPVISTTHPSVVPGPPPQGVPLPVDRPPLGAIPVPPGQVDASSLPRTYPAQVWTEHGGMVVGLDVEQGGCLSTTPTLLSQTATAVTIRLVRTQTGGTARACPMYLTYRPATVSLAAPLRERTVVLRLGG